MFSEKLDGQSNCVTVISLHAKNQKNLMNQLTDFFHIEVQT